MRPVDKGEHPLDEDNNAIIVKEHTQWRKYLIERLGGYCSYCEMSLHDLPQVEHIVAQKIDSSLTLVWSNLLLACGACNRRKREKTCDSTTHYLPHLHNTILAFSLIGKRNNKASGRPALFMEANPALPPPQFKKANATVELLGLDQDTTSDLKKVADLRWQKRHEALLNALLWKKAWNARGQMRTDKFIELLLTAALPTGFFSVWFLVFEDEPIIKKSLIDNFTGTALDCFDQNCNPIPRNAPNDI